MARTPTEQNAADLSVLRGDFGILREKVEALSRDLDDLDAERKADASELKDLRQQVALLSQRLDDHLKRVETWDNRRWGLIMLLIGTVMSLASGLIVTLARK